MLMISMPTTFKVGDTQDCRINGKPERLTWRDEDTAVIEPGDARKIVSVNRSRDLIHFVCGAAGMYKGDYAWDGPILYEKEPGKRFGKEREHE